MQPDRRDFVKLGVAAAASSLLPAGAEGAEMTKNAEQMPAAPGAAPLRLMSFSPKSSSGIRVGALTKIEPDRRPRSRREEAKGKARLRSGGDGVTDRVG